MGVNAMVGNGWQWGLTQGVGIAMAVKSLHIHWNFENNIFFYCFAQDVCGMNAKAFKLKY